MNYCPEEEREVSDQYCSDCAECNRSKSATVRLTEMKIMDPEVSGKLKEQLSLILGFVPEEIEGVIAGMCNRHRDSIANQVENCLTKLSQDFIKIQMESHFDEYLNTKFEEELSAKITIVSKDSDFLKTTIQEIVAKRIKEVLSKDSYDNRKKKYVDERLENVISNRIDGMIEEAMNEVKTEAIDKFNKEMMKKMMSGMANELAGDSRLLHILGA